jgi:hypothetical protein
MFRLLLLRTPLAPFPAVESLSPKA